MYQWQLKATMSRICSAALMKYAILGLQFLFKNTVWDKSQKKNFNSEIKLLFFRSCNDHSRSNMQLNNQKVSARCQLLVETKLWFV